MFCWHHILLSQSALCQPQVPPRNVSVQHEVQGLVLEPWKFQEIVLRGRFLLWRHTSMITGPVKVPQSSGFRTLAGSDVKICSKLLDDGPCRSRSIICGGFVWFKSSFWDESIGATDRNKLLCPHTVKQFMVKIQTEEDCQETAKAEDNFGPFTKIPTISDWQK